MQITSDQMRSAKLLFDLKVPSGDFPSGFQVSAIACNSFSAIKSCFVTGLRCHNKWKKLDYK